METSISAKSFRQLASFGYQGWFVVEAEQAPVVNPPFDMAKKGHAELLRSMPRPGTRWCDEPAHAARRANREATRAATAAFSTFIKSRVSINDRLQAGQRL